MIYPESYTTLELVANQLDKANPAPLANVLVQAEYADFRTQISSLIPSIATIINTYCKRIFLPTYESVDYRFADYATFIVPNGLGRSQVFLSRDLLVLESIGVVKDNNFTAIPSTDYILQTDSMSVPVMSMLIQNVNYYQSSNIQDGLRITGWWGYCTQNVYRAIENVTVNLSSTQIAVSDATLYGTWGYIRIDNEIMLIEESNTVTQVLTVRRAQLGTIASDHTNSIVLRMYPNYDIGLLATRMVAWYWQRRNDVGNTVQFADGSAILPANMPNDMLSILNNNKRIIWSLGS
jgi:hypothetical protein